MVVKFNFEANSKNFTAIQQRTSNIDALNPDNFEMWAFKNCQVTVSDYLKNEYCDDDLIMNVTYTYNDNDNVNSYKYVVDVANNDCKYYVNDTGVYSYNFAQFIDTNSLFYLDAIATLNTSNDSEDSNVELNNNESHSISVGDVLSEIGLDKNSDFNPFTLTDILNYFVKNIIGMDANIAMEDLIGSFDAFNDTCVDEKDNEQAEDNQKMTLVDILTSKLNTDFETEVNSDDDIIALINNEINTKISDGDFKWCMYMKQGGGYYYECNNRKDVLLNSNSIIIKIESVSTDQLNPTIEKAVVKFAKTQDFSNVIFNKLPDNTFMLICEFR